MNELYNSDQNRAFPSSVFKWKPNDLSMKITDRALVPSQSISGVSAVIPLVAFYYIHGKKTLVSCGVRDKTKTQYLFLPWMSQKATKGSASSLEIDCNQTAMDHLPRLQYST
jgi:hypothetical protein